MQRVANAVNIVGDHDSKWIVSILEDVDGASDGSWSLLPYLFAAFMTSTIWDTTTFNVETGGFSNNVHCLVRCISAVIVGSEFVRLEREYEQNQSLSNGHAGEMLNPAAQNYLSIEANIKSVMQLFIKFCAGIILDTWSESNRSHLVAKLIFLDQICEMSPYLPRSTLESHIPYAILRSLYNQYYSNSSTPLALLSASPHLSPAMSLAHASPSMRQPASHSSAHDSGYFKVTSAHDQNQDDSDNFHARNMDNKHRNGRRSGPLDYSLSRKTKFVEGSASASTGPSPLPRFAVSRSGPISYK